MKSRIGLVCFVVPTSMFESFDDCMIAGVGTAGLLFTDQGTRV